MSATVYLETFGCQMNVADSERAAVRLRAAGFNLGDSPESADVIIFNTCSVRRLLHQDRKSTRLNSSHSQISYAVFCLKKKKTKHKYVLVKIGKTDCPESHNTADRHRRHRTYD